MPEYPERAVLESIVNALIHRDYLEYGSEFHIDMFDDRRGSGFKKIVEDYQMYANVSNGAKPVFKSGLSSFFITLPNLQYVVKEQNVTKDWFDSTTYLTLDKGTCRKRSNLSSWW